MFISNPTARFGEDLAAKYLTKKGYKIIERNFRKGYGEIDLIAIKDIALVFFEVKTRTTNLYGGAKESISIRKLQNLIKTVNYYKMTHQNLPDLLRIDAIFITLSPKRDTLIEHIENISGF